MPDEILGHPRDWQQWKTTSKGEEVMLLEPKYWDHSAKAGTKTCRPRQRGSDCIQALPPLSRTILQFPTQSFVD